MVLDLLDVLLVLLLFLPGVLVGTLLSAWCCQGQATCNRHEKPLPSTTVGTFAMRKALPSKSVGKRQNETKVDLDQAFAYVSRQGDCVHLAAGCCQMKDPVQLRVCKKCFR